MWRLTFASLISLAFTVAAFAGMPDPGPALAITVTPTVPQKPTAPQTAVPTWTPSPTPSEQLGTPTDLVAAAIWDAGFIELWWTDNSNDEDGFIVEVAEEFDGPWSAHVVAPDRTWYWHPSVAGQTYWFRVAAFNQSGQSAFSNVASATGLPTFPTPTAVTTAPPSATPSPTPTPPKPLGDVNGDGQVNSVDSFLLLTYSAGMAFAPYSPKHDVDSDGWVNAIDAALILQYDAGLIDSFPGFCMIEPWLCG